MSKTERLFHPRTLVIHPDFKNLEEFIVSIPERFQRNEGTVIHQGRNELRKMEYNGKEYVIKSFHSPHLINRFVYGIFRPSKAKRSYDHAEMLLKIGVGTPQPVGYMNIRSGLLFDKSYYISLLSTCPYISAWGEIIYRVDGCLAVPQCRYLTYSHAFFVWYLSEPKEKRYGNEIDK